MTIGLVISALVVTIFSASSSTYQVADTVGALQETGRVALDSIDRDVQMAGFRGCNSNNVEAVDRWSMSSSRRRPTSTISALRSKATSTPARAGRRPCRGPSRQPHPAPLAGSDVLVVRVRRRHSGDPLGADGFSDERYPGVLDRGVRRERQRLHRGLQRDRGVPDLGLRRHGRPAYARAPQQQRLARTCLRGRRARHALRDARLLRRAEQPESSDRNLLLDDNGAAAAPSRSWRTSKACRFNTARTPTPTTSRMCSARRTRSWTSPRSWRSQVNLLLRGARSNEAQTITNYVFNGADGRAGRSATRGACIRRRSNFGTALYEQPIRIETHSTRHIARHRAAVSRHAVDLGHDRHSNLEPRGKNDGQRARPADRVRGGRGRAAGRGARNLPEPEPQLAFR